MIAVIIAGGKGSRLWPMSTSDRPKHLLSLVGDKTLLQNTYERAKKLTDKVYILTDESHHQQVHEQLQELAKDQFIIEPGRRGTASCIVLALAKIAAKHGDDAEVAFFHADHQINDSDSFVLTVKDAVNAASENQAIALIGIKPDHPATGFGYIKLGEKIGDAYKVQEFREKPDLKTAEEYLKSDDYLWNLGLFTASIKVFKQAFVESAPELATAYEQLSSSLDNAEDLFSCYSKLESQPIDTALIEKTKNLVVVKGVFDWMDVGSFKDLHAILKEVDRYGNSVLGDADQVYLDETTSSVIVTNNKPVAVIGLSDVVVVDSEDGLLVCHKDMVQEVKKAAENFSD
ncbi:mannose-1-phosphate guanylyltransferase [Candidatus Saccharibacteria bacterium]|nr:mannose-1-phosphate guanylyltransferase [Candidatus Saccharibacteria bacterium]